MSKLHSRLYSSTVLRGMQSMSWCVSKKLPGSLERSSTCEVTSLNPGYHSAFLRWDWDDIPHNALAVCSRERVLWCGLWCRNLIFVMIFRKKEKKKLYLTEFLQAHFLDSHNKGNIWGKKYLNVDYGKKYTHYLILHYFVIGTNEFQEGKLYYKSKTTTAIINESK